MNTLIVLDNGSTWFLYEEDQALYLEALCSHSAADYIFIIEMSPKEQCEYKKSGAKYLDWLAHEIHYSAPGVIGNKSIYMERRATSECYEKTKMASKLWRESVKK